jgi:hypothetical protein
MLKVLPLLLLISCGMSTQKGTYTGVIQDVQFGGLMFNSCEITFKTSLESSQQQAASSRSEALCLELEKNIGAEVNVKYKNSLFNPLIDSNYIIESVSFNKGKM